MPEMAAIYAFQEYSQRWMAADAAGREAMHAEGLRLAEARRPEFKKLIVADPRRALEESVPRVARQDMPADIMAALEKPVSGTGNYNMYQGRPAEGQSVTADQLTLRYFETAQGESYRAHVFGLMEAVTSKKDVPLRGVAVDREMAVAESPVRRLETGERVATDATVEALCPVSGQETETVPPEEPITEETPAVEVGSRVILLCNGSHVTVLDEKYKNLLQASGPGGAGYFFSGYPGDSSEALGNFRCLYIRITYPDQLRAPNTEDSAYGDMRNVSRFYLENSYGKLTSTSTVTPLIVMPHTQAWYIAKDDEVDGLGLLHGDARAEARKLGYDSRQFNCTIVRVNGGPRLSGISWGGGDSVWVSWDGMDVLNHECGHSLGRNHANFWKTTDGTPYGDGANEEYGNPFDVMGGGGGFGAHYNSISKRALGWLPDPYVHKPAANGVYRIHAYDQPQLQEGRRYAFRVAKDSARTYYVEYHPANRHLTDSAVVLYSWSGMSNAGHLVDTTPGSADGKNDGGIRIGRTYTDPEADMHFTVLSKNATQPPSLDLMYNHGPFPGNRLPEASLSASAATVSPGGSITFTAAATDPDGDTLAYHWDFNDGVPVTSTPVFTRVFPSTDQMTVHLTVSDMKGGTTRRHVLINVGSHGRRTITGRVVAGGQPLADVRITNGSKYSFTDSDGNYILSDLTSGSHALTATLAGHTFTPGFNNPLNATSGTNTANWTANPAVLVSLIKTSDAAEGGANGVFTLTRTGPASSALKVRVATADGTAAFSTDYAFSPNYANDGLFKTFTIPAGAASLPIRVTAVNDTSQEGPETVILSLASNGNYFASGLNYAVMTIEDNDSNLPKVRVLPTGPYAMESASPQAGEFTFYRSGDAADALTLSVTWSGTAGNGTDYTTLPSTVIFPAGRKSATVSVAPVNDSAIETPEDCTVAISSGAAYLRDSAAQSATVVISDDDTPVVTVTALDVSVSEEGRDPGVFLITRTGGTAAPLKVYYGLSGSALHGTDYIALPGEITIPAGTASAPVTVTPYDDDLGEPEEQSVVLNLTTFNNAYSVGAANSATVDIRDNDDRPVVSVRAGTSPAEPSTAGTFIFRAIGSATGNITVRYTVSGTATEGTDYARLSGAISLSANGSNDVTVNIPVRNDTLPEPTETIIVTITPDAAYEVHNDGVATARLKDDERGTAVMVSTWNTTPAEGGAAGKFYLSRGNASNGALAVKYTLSGTAVNGADYTLLSGTATIPGGEMGVDVNVTPVNDTLVEGTETVTLTVDSGTNYDVEHPGSATLHLQDNESPPISVRFASTTGATTEAPDAARGEYRDIPVQLSTTSTNEVTVEYTCEGGTAAGDNTDWAFVNPDDGNVAIPGGVLIFPAGATTQNIRIRVKNDGVAEGDETAILTLQNARFARVPSSAGTHTLTIRDANNPVRRVSFLTASGTRSETEGGEPMLMAVLDRAADNSAPVSVNCTVSGTATPGGDFIPPPGTLTFAAGQSFKVLPLVILPDSEDESPETVIITLTDPANAELGGITTFTLTIRESTIPALNVTTGAAIVAENAPAADFTITRGGTVSTLPLTVHYTLGGSAVAGIDFTAPASAGSLVIPADADSSVLSIALLNDDLEDGGKTLTVTLAPDAAYALGLNSQSMITIQDDDAPPSVTILEPSAKSAAIPSGVGLMVRAEGTAVTPQGITTVPTVWSLVSGPGEAAFELDSGRTAVKFTANGDYLLRATASDGDRGGSADLMVTVGAVRTAQDVGGATALGSWTESDAVEGSGRGGKITLSGGGSGISGSGTSDGFYFLAAPVTGDFDVRCRLTALDNPGNSGSCRAGIMVRASTAANAPYAMSLFKSDLNHAFQARTAAGSNPYDSTGGTPFSLPAWLRLVRTGNTFSAYHSTDGGTWTQRGSTQTIAGMGNSPLLGFAVTSAAEAMPSTASFEGYTGNLPTNIGPAVSAGTAPSGTAPWSLDATVTDDGLPASTGLSTLWRQMDGPGTSAFTAATAVDTGVNFPASGTYRLRLSASDGAVTTFAEIAATVSASMTPLQAWRLAHFGIMEDSGEAANLADSDQDGLANLLEYALGAEPKAATAPPLEMTSEGGQWTLRFPRRDGGGQVVLTLQSSADLEIWTAVARSENGNTFTTVDLDATTTETAGENGIVAVKVALSAATDQAPKRYFRLLAEPTPVAP